MLPQVTPVPRYTTDTYSPITMGPQNHPPYGVPAYILVSTYPPHMLLAAHMYHSGPPSLSSHQPISSQTQESVTQHGTHQLPITVIHRIQDTEPNMVIIRTTPPPPLHGYSPYRWLAYSGYPPQPLPVRHPPLASTVAPAASINMEETMKFLVDKEKEEISPKV